MEFAVTGYAAVLVMVRGLCNPCAAVQNTHLRKLWGVKLAMSLEGLAQPQVGLCLGLSLSRRCDNCRATVQNATVAKCTVPERGTLTNRTCGTCSEKRF